MLKFVSANKKIPSLLDHYQRVSREVHAAETTIQQVRMREAEERVAVEARQKAIEQDASRKRRLEEAIENVAATAPLSDVEQIRNWIDDEFDPELLPYNLNKLSINDDLGLGGTNKTRRPLNWREIAIYHRFSRTLASTLRSFPILGLKCDGTKCTNQSTIKMRGDGSCDGREDRRYS